MMINEQNWTHCEFTAEENRVNLSIGGEILKDNSYLELYFINKFLGEEIIHQDIFHKLNDALQAINTKYGHWDFKDKLKSEKSSGCSSCQAH